MKRTFVLMLALIMAFGAFTLPALAEGHTIVKRDIPLVADVVNGAQSLPLYFIEGVEDLPWLEINDFAAIFNEVVPCQVVLSDHQAALQREDGYSMTLDFEQDTITFDDYNAFLRMSEASTLLDIIHLKTEDEAGEPVLFQKNYDYSFDRYGDTVVLPLGDYDIHLIAQDGLYLAPVQTLFDFTVTQMGGVCLFFNGECAILGSPDMLTIKGNPYYDVPAGERSAAMCEYGYNELCMMLDRLYGLREPHGIESFDQLFDQIGFKDSLKDPNPLEADLAIDYLIRKYLDDLHSSFTALSSKTGNPEVTVEWGPSYAYLRERLMTHMAIRDAFYPDGIPDYEEVGNTAYITFDHFVLGSDNAEAYYGADLPEDTVGLIIRAHEQITREDSPIENVVIDLSCNLGGTVDAAAFVIAWYLGEGSVAIRDSFTGAMSHTDFRADTNLDRAFDEKDTVENLNLFCLISPASFSCGNLVPCMFKESNKVTLLGRTSGGGSCGVMTASSAWGTGFQISGPNRLSFLKNGSFYDIDRGAEPDFTLTSPEKYYDREALTEYINSLY